MELRALHAALDDIVEEMETLKGVIVDLRFNLGGNGIFSMTAVERFTHQKRIAFKQRARCGDGLTEPVIGSMDPTGKKCFPKKN